MKVLDADTINSMVDHDPATMERLQHCVEAAISAVWPADRPMNERAVQSYDHTIHWLLETARAAAQIVELGHVLESDTRVLRSDASYRASVSATADDLLLKCLMLTSGENSAGDLTFWLTAVVEPAALGWLLSRQSRRRATAFDAWDARLAEGRSHRSRTAGDMVCTLSMHCSVFLAGLDHLLSEPHPSRSEVYVSLLYLQSWALELGSLSVLMPLSLNRL